MSSNPVFRTIERGVRSGQYQASAVPQSAYGGPIIDAPASTRMTLDDVVTKTLGLFGLLLVVAAGSFVVAQRGIDEGKTTTALGLWMGGAVVAFVLSLVIGFRKSVSVPLILAYTVFEGLFLGAISAYSNYRYPGVVGQAILATLCVFMGMLLGYKTGVIKVSARSRRIFSYMLLGYLLFGIVNLLLVVFHVSSGWGIGGSGMLGLAISLFAVALASYSLAIDFDTIQNSVNAGVPKKTSWLMGYGLMVSVVWLYVEMLRLLSRARD